MEKTRRDLLVRALENLPEESLKKFKNKLNDSKIKEGYDRIPRGKLQKADTEDVASYILSYYTEPYGIEVTLAVLEAINENQEAEDLRIALRKVNGGGPVQETNNGAGGGAPSGAPSKEPTQETASGDQEHFVDRHRVELVQWIPLVAPILDYLLQKKLLKREQYNKVQNKDTSQDQMRELYKYVENWDREGKDELLKSLREYHSPIIRRLEKS